MLEDLIKRLKEDIRNAKFHKESLDTASWGSQEGVIMSCIEAEMLINNINSLQEEIEILQTKDRTLLFGPKKLEVSDDKIEKLAGFAVEVTKLTTDVASYGPNEKFTSFTLYEDSLKRTLTDRFKDILNKN